MKNKNGVDVDYLKKNLNLVLRDLDNYTADELTRTLRSLANVTEWAAEPVPSNVLLSCPDLRLSAQRHGIRLTWPRNALSDTSETVTNAARLPANSTNS